MRSGRGRFLVPIAGRSDKVGAGLEKGELQVKSPALTFLWSATVALCGLLASPPGHAEATVLHRATVAEPDTLDPQKTFGAGALVVDYDLFEGLMSFDERGELDFGLAESYDVSEDGLVFTFTLRGGLKWSDGAALTADDIVYSFRRVQNPETAAIYAQRYYVIENARAVNKGLLPLEALGVHALDARTVRFTLERPMPYFPKLMSLITAMPVPRHVVEEHGYKWTRPGVMVSNGAYRLAERVLADHVRMEKNPHYHKSDAVKIDTVFIRLPGDLNTSVKQFRTGEFDVILNFPPGRLEWIRENLSESLRLSPGIGTYVLAFNNARPPFDDVRVRKALSLALDRDVIVNRVLDTGLDPAFSIVPPTVSGYEAQPDASIRGPMNRRTDQARALLARAGYGPANPLALTLYHFVQEEQRQVAVAAQGMWREIGVEAEIMSVQFGALFLRRRKGDFDIIFTSLYAGFDDPIPFLNQYETRNIAIGANPSRYSNADYDRLITDADRILDPAARLEMLQAAERALLADYPVAPVFFYNYRRLINPKVKGWFDNPLGINLSRHLWIAN